MERAPRLLLVEDNETTAQTLRLFLESQGYDVLHAATGRAARERLVDPGIDLVVLDLMLPDVDGLTICRELRRRSAVPVVMLTARSSEDHIVEGLEAGADDYVCKPFGSRELLARVRRCLERAQESEQAPGTGTRLRVGALELDLDRREAILEGASVKLTRSEFDVLHLLMRHPGRVFTRGQLIEHALGPETMATERTIDTHVWSLRKKLDEPRGAPRYILSELGVGYRMNDHHAG